MIPNKTFLFLYENLQIDKFDSADFKYDVMLLYHFIILFSNCQKEKTPIQVFSEEGLENVSDNFFTKYLVIFGERFSYEKSIPSELWNGNVS